MPRTTRHHHHHHHHHHHRHRRRLTAPTMMASLASLAFLVLALASPVFARAPSARANPTITIDIQKGDLQNVIRLLAAVGDVNVVVGEDVKGTVTLKLKNVHWRQALDVVLRAQGYGVVDDEGVLLIMPQARIDADVQAALDRAADETARGPLRTKAVQLNNARAAELVPIVKSLLSPRGTVSVDERTNTLIIRDVAGSSALR